MLDKSPGEILREYHLDPYYPAHTKERLEERNEALKVLYEEFSRLNSFTKRLSFFQQNRLDPSTNYGISKESPIRIGIRPGNPDEEEIQNKAHFEYLLTFDGNSFESLKGHFIKRLNKSPNPKEIIQNEIKACEELLFNSAPAFREIYKIGYDDAINVIEPNFRKKWVADKLSWYIKGRAMAFYKSYLENELKSFNNVFFDSKEYFKPYPTVSDYQMLAKNLEYEEKTAAFGEIIGDWIINYRIDVYDFYNRFNRFLGNEYDGERPGTMVGFLRNWWKFYGKKLWEEKAITNEQKENFPPPSITKEIQITEEGIAQSLKALAPYFEKNDLEEIQNSDESILQSSSLKQVLSGKSIGRKLVFKGYSAQFVYLFLQLKESGKIIDTKVKINEWVCKNFLYTNRKTKKSSPFDPANVKQSMNPTKKAPRESIKLI